MTPLIDVVFLLLLFFMLSSTFSNFGEVELNQASGGEAQQAAPSDRFFVQLGAARLVLNGAPTKLDDLAEQMERGQVLVSLDTDVSAQRLVDLLVRLRGQPELTVLVLE
ncbi:MAG: biopolymer transporter ExbD [Tateyamaria sp.]|jgi:biopolymer transport protein ExbD|uniref:ExbD/TolR family protein n=1 Tax=Tateyamaria sp. TaxID=1929288 RepID=UPI0032DC8E52